MLLYTQDGDILKFKNIIRIYINEYNAVRCDIGEATPVTLGVYETRERCEEITKEITVKYNDLKKYELRDKSGNYNNNIYESYIYYMPEE